MYLLIYVFMFIFRYHIFLLLLYILNSSHLLTSLAYNCSSNYRQHTSSANFLLAYLACAYKISIPSRICALTGHKVY